MAEYIDKLSVYKEACAGCTCHGDEIGSCFSSEPCERLCFAFASAHAADVAPVVHARWASVPGKRERICSRCQCDKPYKFADENAKVFEYCPHCGAKMDGGAK